MHQLCVYLVGAKLQSPEGVDRSRLASATGIAAKKNAAAPIPRSDGVSILSAPDGIPPPPGSGFPTP